MDALSILNNNKEENKISFIDNLLNNINNKIYPYVIFHYILLILIFIFLILIYKRLK